LLAIESTDAAVQRRSREQAAEAADIIRSRLRPASPAALAAWLGHADQRVRLRAQLELAGRPEATAMFEQVLRAGTGLARRHAVWGLWVRARRLRDAAATAALVAVLADSDPEIRGQAARALGEAVGARAEQLQPLVADPEPRVAAFAALALGRIGAGERKPVIIERLRRLDQEPRRDPFLRHGLIMGLAGCTGAAELAALATDPCATLRLAAVVALRRHRSLAVAAFLRDADRSVASEAVRALHDQYIEPWHEARPFLADLLAEIARGTSWHPLDDVMANRLLHATFRCGRPQDLETLLQVAGAEGFAPQARREALRLVGLWRNPPRVDQSLGVYDPLTARDTDMEPSLERHLPALLAADSEFAADAVAILRRCGASLAALPVERQRELVLSPATRPAYRIALLDLLLAPDETAAAETSVTAALGAESGRSLCLELLDAADLSVAAKALSLLVPLDPAAAASTAGAWVESTDAGRARAGWQALGRLPGLEAASRIAAAFRASPPTLPGALLELLEAAESRREQEVVAALAAWRKAKPREDALARYDFAVDGGAVDRGRKVFESVAAAKCTQCHKIEPAGEGHAPVVDVGGIGPNLAGLSRRADARSILESLVAPSAVIVPGYGTVSLVLDDGTVATGVVVEETQETIRLRGADPAKPDAIRSIPTAEIESRSTPISAMPPMGPILKPRELRDLVAYLRSL
jgi:quinoprotein glucose dehydrogenase